MFTFLNHGAKITRIPSGIIAIATLAVLAAVIATLALGSFTAQAQEPASSANYNIGVTAEITQDDNGHPNWPVGDSGFIKDDDAGTPAWRSLHVGNVPTGVKLIPQIRVYAGVAE